MGRTDSKISSLIAASIDQYEDHLYMLAVAGTSDSFKIELLKSPDSALVMLPSESLGLGSHRAVDAHSAETRLVSSRVGLENIAAADAAIGDAGFVKSCFRLDTRLR